MRGPGVRSPRQIDEELSLWEQARDSPKPECFILRRRHQRLARRCGRIREGNTFLSLTELTMKRLANAKIDCAAPPLERSSVRPREATLVAGWQGGVETSPGLRQWKLRFQLGASAMGVAGPAQMKNLKRCGAKS